MKRFDPHERMPRGLPRPLAEHPKTGKLLPVPYSQSGNEWGVIGMNHQYCMPASLCLVCGEAVEQGSIFAVVGQVIGSGDPLPSYLQSNLERHEVLDSGPLHERCAALTAAHCPEARTKLATGEIVQRPYERSAS